MCDVEMLEDDGVEIPKELKTKMSYKLIYGYVMVNYYVWFLIHLNQQRYLIWLHHMN
jgi:hypothetical protein